MPIHPTDQMWPLKIVSNVPGSQFSDPYLVPLFFFSEFFLFLCPSLLINSPSFQMTASWEVVAF